MSQSHNESVVVLTAAIQRVRDLHKPMVGDSGGSDCTGCNDYYPCRTIKALNGEQK